MADGDENKAGRGPTLDEFLAKLRGYAHVSVDSSKDRNPAQINKGNSIPTNVRGARGFGYEKNGRRVVGVDKGRRKFQYLCLNCGKTGECQPHVFEKYACKCHQLRDLTGLRFGQLVVLHKTRAKHWWCVCDCGNESEKQQNNLLRGATTSCGCSRFYVGHTANNWKGVGVVPRQRFASVVNGAKARSIEVSITIDYISELFDSQRGRCALTGQSIGFGHSGRHGQPFKETTASLDRIDSAKGYIPENVQWVHKDVNMLKADMSEEKFVAWCRKIGQFDRYSPCGDLRVGNTDNALPTRK